MPNMGGIEVLHLIMKDRSHPDVIMHTQVADREVAKQALNAGAFDYVLKLAEPEAIESSIIACLEFADYQNPAVVEETPKVSAGAVSLDPLHHPPKETQLLH